MKPERILINQPRSSYFVGGAEMVSLEHAKYMAESGHHVTFMTISPESIRQDYSKQYYALRESTDIQFIELNQPEESLSIYDIDPGESRDRWNIESLHYNAVLFDHIQSNSTHYEKLISYYKMDALVIPRRKVAQSALYLCGVPSEDNSMMSSYLAMYDTSIAITEDTRNYWQKYSTKPIPVVYTGVDTDRFKPYADKNDASIDRISFIGRLIERKGCDLFIAALSSLDDHELKKLDISIIGDGPQRENLYNQVNELMPRTKVEFMGAVDNPERLLSESHICVLPSRRGEGLQGVLLEAMASGNHVVATNSDINSKILGNGRGTVVDIEDPLALRDAIRGAIQKQGSNSSELARSYVMEHHDWRVLTKQLLKEIDS